MAFAQLTYRESLRDIEACLHAQQTKLYHLGIRAAVSRSTLVDANEWRDWRIYADLAQAFIDIARRLYVDEPFGVDLDNTVYALDASTIDLCLSVFPWAPFRQTKAAVKLHTLLDLRGNIPTFIHLSDGKLHDVSALDLLIPEPGAFYVMDRGYLDFARLYRLTLVGAFFVIRCPSPTSSSGGSTPSPPTRTPGSAIRASCSPASILPSAMRRSCGASSTTRPPPRRPWCFSLTTSRCRR
jgi:hypothetical protein